MKSPRTKFQAGFSLVEVLVYMTVMVVVVGIGYAALYRSMDTSNALRRNGEDIANALRTGENWRADVRATRGQIQQTTTDDGQIISLPRSRGKVSYRFAEHTVFRRVGTNPWTPVLKNVEASAFVSEARTNVTVWRWELELQTRAKKLTRLRPLFTFLAVPSGELPR